VLQLVNGAQGGPLHHDLPSEQPGGLQHDPVGPRDSRTHEISLTPGSRHHRALETTALSSNSFHHQAIRVLARGLSVTARADDGVIEGVEGSEEEAGWLLAVQWHPEEFHHESDSPDQRLFRALVKATSDREDSKDSNRLPPG
jgi:putative glutamine amidotransferase